MKKALVLIPIVAALAACSSTQNHSAIAQGPMLVKENVAIDNAPSWMIKLPKEEGVIFGSATARSRDYEMAVEKAISLAQGKIAETVNGVVSKQTKTYRRDQGRQFREDSVSVTRKVANNADFVGVETSDIKVIRESDGFYRAYALVRLPYGDANSVLLSREERGLDSDAMSMEREMRDMDSQQPVKPVKSNAPVSVTPVPANPVVATPAAPSTLETRPVSQIDRSTLIGPTVSDPVVAARVNEVLARPDAVVMKATVQ
jgi:hypothetical protein